MFEQQIAKGLAVLTNTEVNKINLTRLNMVSSFDCVLGQLYGEYSRGKAYLNIASHEQAVESGFNIDAMGHKEVFGALTLLTQEWRQAITARRETTNQLNAELWT